MKRLTEYTNVELVALTEEELTNLVNTECAHEGAPLLSLVAPIAPVKPGVVPNAPCYIIDVPTLRFGEHIHAQAVADYLNQNMKLDVESIGKSTWGAPYQLVPSERECTVKAEAHWTPEYYAENQEALETYERLKTQFDKLLMQKKN